MLLREKEESEEVRRMRKYGESNIPITENKTVTYNGFFVSSDGGMGALVGEQEDINTVRELCTSSKCCAEITLLCLAIWYSRSN